MKLLFKLFVQNGGPLKKYDFWKDVNHAFGENYIPAQFASKFGTCIEMNFFPKDIVCNNAVQFHDNFEHLKFYLFDNGCMF